MEEIQGEKVSEMSIKVKSYALLYLFFLYQNLTNSNFKTPNMYRTIIFVYRHTPIPQYEITLEVVPRLSDECVKTNINIT